MSTAGSRYITLIPVILYEGTVPASGNGVRTRPSTTAIWHLQEGTVSFRTESRSYRYKAPCWLLLPPRWQRHQSFTRHHRIVSLGYEARWASGLDILQAQEPVVTEDSPAHGLAGDLQELLRLRSREQGSDSRNLQQSLWFHDLLSRIFHALVPIYGKHGWLADRGPADHRLQILQEELARNPTIKPLSESFLRSRTGIGREQIDRLLLQDTGLTLAQTQQQLCTRRSEELLLTTSLSVKEVAAHLGFTDSSHFCRWFRRHHGSSPGALRKGQA